MKVVMRPIEMLAWFTEEGILKPLKCKFILKDKSVCIVKIDKIITRTEEKLAGNKMIIYRCQSEFNGIMRTFELKYENSTCKWFLYKI
ncbi:hypothetical protein RDV78_05520 [Bacillota bacterium LX-D]|nr:hypothetical protein [Bacillota bacterium LX-D]